MDADTFFDVLESYANQQNFDEYDFWYEPHYYLGSEVTEISPGLFAELVDFHEVTSDIDHTNPEEVWMVFKVGTQYFRRDGVYASFVGFDWDKAGFREVFPVIKTVTVFE